MRHLLPFSNIALLMLILSACTNDPKVPKVEAEKLIGRWEIETGYRNGKKTETLSGTFFEFAPDGKMKTNLTPTATEETYDYSVSDNTIVLEGDALAYYTVDTLTDSKLNISMTINNYPFKVWLKKAEAGSEDDEQEGIMQ